MSKDDSYGAPPRETKEGKRPFLKEEVEGHITNIHNGFGIKNAEIGVDFANGEVGRIEGVTLMENTPWQDPLDATNQALSIALDLIEYLQDENREMKEDMKALWASIRTLEAKQ